MNNNNATPSADVYSPDLALTEIGPILSEQVESEERVQRLSQRSIGALREAGFLKLFLPASLGGFERDPLTVAKLVEGVARNNATAAWMMMVANVSAWWTGKLPEQGIEEVYSNGPDTLMAGAFHPPMKAIPVKGGYHINGRSPLTSNVHEAQWIFVTAFVFDGDQLKTHDGIPEVRGIVMKAKEVKILDTWHTLGMRATDSNDIQVDNVFVPEHRSFVLMPGFPSNRYYQSPLYQFPAIGAGIASLIAPTAIAIAQNAIQEVKLLAERKVPFGSTVSIRERGSVQRKIGMAEALVQSSRAYLHSEISACWEKVKLGRIVPLEQKATLLLAATHANQSCVQAVDLMYSAGGSSAIYTRNKLSLHFANAQVIRHHGFANESRYETVAQVYLGLMPDLPVVEF